MAEGGKEDQEKSEYKDHYKRILVDLIGRRNSAGFLENEEAIEGMASNSLFEVGDQVVAAGTSHEDTPLESDQACVSTPTAARCHNLASSLQHTLMDSTDEGLAVFHRRVPTPEPGNGAACPAVSDNQLLDDRKTPEGDLPPLVLTAALEVGSSLTPEPSMISLTGERQDPESGVDDGTPTGLQKKKKWRIFKGFKNPLAPK